MTVRTDHAKFVAQISNVKYRVFFEICRHLDRMKLHMEKARTIKDTIALQEDVLILDGGLATELERKGCDISTPLWSAEILARQPDVIQEVHLEYYVAGADVAITSSYQASVLGLLKHQPKLTVFDATDLIKRSVHLARSAAIQANDQGITRKLFVAGSVGPYGAYLADGSEYRGDYELTSEELKDFHRARILALAEAGVDVLAFETIPSFAEAQALVDLLKEWPDLNAWISFTLKDTAHISDGTPLEKIALLVENNEQIIAIGFNCIPENLVIDALAMLQGLTAKPLVVYPNSGESWNASSRSWNGKPVEGSSLEESVQTWRRSGAKLIGGCCRTTPSTIETMRKAVDPSHP